MITGANPIPIEKSWDVLPTLIPKLKVIPLSPKLKLPCTHGVTLTAIYAFNLSLLPLTPTSTPSHPHRFIPAPQEFSLLSIVFFT